MTKLDDELSELYEELPAPQQQRVLEFVRELLTRQLPGLPGTTLAAFGGRIPADVLQQMQVAIEEGCETVNVSKW